MTEKKKEYWPLHENIRIYHECEGGVEKSVLRSTIWHRKESLAMPKGAPQVGLFYPTLTQVMDSFSCSPLNTAFKIFKIFKKRLPEVSEYAEI